MLKYILQDNAFPVNATEICLDLTSCSKPDLISANSLTNYPCFSIAKDFN